VSEDRPPALRRGFLLFEPSLNVKIMPAGISFDDFALLLQRNASLPLSRCGNANVCKAFFHNYDIYDLISTFDFTVKIIGQRCQIIRLFKVFAFDCGNDRPQIALDVKPGFLDLVI
jgi:hypothetical protein